MRRFAARLLLGWGVLGLAVATPGPTLAQAPTIQRIEAQLPRGHTPIEEALASRIEQEAPASTDARLLGIVGGGLLGLGIGAGLGYLSTSDPQAGCDDGVCAWVVPAIAGGAIGLGLGAWLGHRIAVGFETR